MSLTGLEEDFAAQRLDVVQSIMAAIVSSCKIYGGALRQFVVDDKGCVAIIGLGVAHHTFDDNAARAVETAHVLRTKVRFWPAWTPPVASHPRTSHMHPRLTGQVQNLGKQCAIGVSQGAHFATPLHRLNIQAPHPPSRLRTLNVTQAWRFVVWWGPPTGANTR